MTTNEANTRRERSTNRRQLLGSLAAGGGLMLAGCLGDDDGGDGDGDGDSDTDGDGDDEPELGEQVPTIQFQFPTGLGSISAEIEEVTQIITENMNEHLGLETDIEPVEMVTMYNGIYNGERNAHFWVDGTLAGPQDYDPYPLMRESHILWAGANGKPNHANYANCEYSEIVSELPGIGDLDEREEMITEAFSVASHDVERIPLHPSVSRLVWNQDYVNLADPGEMGYRDHNLDLWLESEAVGDNTSIITQTTPASIPGDNFQATSELPDIIYLGRMANAPLVSMTRDFEVEPFLASDFSINEDATAFNFDLREDATFHNGDPVLAEDVVWTYEFLQNNAGSFPYVVDIPYSRIEATDDYRVEIETEQPFAGFVEQHANLWGILHSDSWIEGGAEENPTEVDWGYTGSGPWQVSDYTHRQILQLEPYEDFHRPPNAGIIYEAYADSQSAHRAFTNESIHLFQPSGGVYEELSEQENVGSNIGYLLTDRWLAPQHPISPGQFVEFREAVARILDRQLILELGTQGHGEPHLYSCIFNWTHPYYPDNPEESLKRLAEGTAPEPDKAEQILEDAGWGWDDDGNLRYPPDLELAPMWPEGSEPAEHPEDFPCVEELESP